MLYFNRTCSPPAVLVELQQYLIQLQDFRIFKNHTEKSFDFSVQNSSCTRHCNTLQHTATHCNTLRHTATHCDTLQHTATHCNTLRHTATHCNTLQHTATHCYTLQRTGREPSPIPTLTGCNTAQHAATRHKTLQQCTATYRNNILQRQARALPKPHPPTHPPTRTS